ncbi:MAG: hypothetical protein R6V02_00665 [Candidatus Aminicenantes bacterium]
MPLKRSRRLVKDHFETALIILIIIGVLAIAFLVHYKLAFLNFFFIPVMLSAYFLGRDRGVLTAVLCVLVVFFYLLLFGMVTGPQDVLALDEIISLTAWAGFLILTGAILGAASEQRQKRLENLNRAYVGLLEILFSYLQCGDETRPESMRVAHLAGRIAVTAGKETREVENIKSAALLCEIGNLRENISLFIEMTEFVGREISDSSFRDREKVMLQSTASLLAEVQPLVQGYYIHYVEESDKMVKDLKEIPFGSAVIALANIYEKIRTGARPFQNRPEFSELSRIKELAGTAFHESAVNALMLTAVSLRTAQP